MARALHRDHGPLVDKAAAGGSGVPLQVSRNRRPASWRRHSAPSSAAQMALIVNVSLPFSSSCAAGYSPTKVSAMTGQVPSPIPYNVDVVDFDAADAEFKTFVFQNEPIVWIQ